MMAKEKKRGHAGSLPLPVCVAACLLLPGPGSVRAHQLHAGRPQLDAALKLTHRIFDDFEFDGKATDTSTPVQKVLRDRHGVCQDFAQLMIGCLRRIGLPARYLSGYILRKAL